jgi:RNA ligase (TIGR02306 family)
MSVASIQQVRDVRPHPNADALDLCTVLGWQVVVKKGEFKSGDQCVYIEIDSVLPDRPEFEFLRNKNFRIKPIRLRGSDSAGIAFPLNILPQGNVYDDGQDVTDLIGAKHYEKPLPAELAGKAIGNLPGFLIMTDEKNLRSNPEALDELKGREYYITRKDDGSSATYFIKNGEFGVCSRKIHLAETEGNTIWKLAREHDIEAKLKDFFRDQDVAIQGEIVGPSVQKNPLGLQNHELHVFNIFFIQERTYGALVQVQGFCNGTGIPMVSLIEMGDKFNYDIPKLVKLANVQRYPTGKPAEGIVIRPQWPLRSTVLNKDWSGKIINENYEDKS